MEQSSNTVGGARRGPTAREARALASRDTFTTGEVAKLCRVAPRTASKWFDTGKLAGYRIPGSNDRRIPRDSLVRFMTENHIPLGPLDGRDGSRLALVVGATPAWVASFAAALGSGWDVWIADGLWEAAELAATSPPDVTVLDHSLGGDGCREAARAMRRASIPVAAIVGDDGPTELDAVYDFVTRAGDDPAALAQLLAEPRPAGKAVSK